ncbi:hypothetical protein CgunFtcFv8_001231 [Champsocephalus gunnari]|uniref:Uncharacterized protein n=1 Tax=Champsocephalus gunnari TaxID=52237 RepID=A0AAN8DUB8_CHAGU|nr:hypothetical protein CgunFtcFv8_001231 [Champsocephalus gunnari]
MSSKGSRKRSGDGGDRKRRNPVMGETTGTLRVSRRQRDGPSICDRLPSLNPSLMSTQRNVCKKQRELSV